jgi:hypothetical protein
MKIMMMIMLVMVRRCFSSVEGGKGMRLSKHKAKNMFYHGGFWVSREGVEMGLLL